MPSRARRWRQSGDKLVSFLPLFQLPPAKSSNGLCPCPVSPHDDGGARQTHVAQESVKGAWRAFEHDETVIDRRKRQYGFRDASIGGGEKSNFAAVAGLPAIVEEKIKDHDSTHHLDFFRFFQRPLSVGIGALVGCRDLNVPISASRKPDRI